jgi:hypothetical protein
MVLDVLGDLFDMLLGMLINVPLDSIQAEAYVVVNLLLQLFAALTGGDFGGVTPTP